MALLEPNTTEQSALVTLDVPGTTDPKEVFVAVFDGHPAVSRNVAPGTSAPTTVPEVDWDALRAQDPKLARAYEEHLREEREYQRLCEMERRMGA